MAVAADMQIKSDDLLSLNQRLIPPSLAFSFGLPYDGDELNIKVAKEQPSHNSHAPKSSPSRKRHHGDEFGGPPSSSTFADASPAGTAQAAKADSSQRADTSLQSPGAAQHPSSVGALLQQATSTQQQQQHVAPQQQQQQASSMSAGFAQRPPVPPQAAAAAAAAAAALNPYAAAYNSAAAAYRFQPQTLLPYMGAAPQAMAMPALSGSLGCASMGMYGAAGDYSQLMRAQEEDADDTQARALKRPRLVWTAQLHKLFEEAVQKIGLDKAVPKTIMQYMNVEGLTRENVASHLQKYRLSLKKTTTDADGKQAAADASTGVGNDMNDAGGAAASAAPVATGTGSGSGSRDVLDGEAEAATCDSSKRGADGAPPDRLHSAASGPSGAAAHRELATAAVAASVAAAQDSVAAAQEALAVVAGGEQQQQQEQQHMHQ